MPRVRGRVPLARAVRPDGRASARPGRTPANAPVAVPAMARPRCRAAEEEGALARGRPAAARAPRAPPTRPDVDAQAIGAVPPLAARDGAGGRGARDRRVAERVRPGSLVPRSEPRDDPRAGSQRLACGRPPRTGLLRSARGAPRASRHRAHARRTKPARVLRRGRHRDERGRMWRPPPGARRPRPDRRDPRVLLEGSRRDGTPARGGAASGAGARSWVRARRVPRRLPRAPGPGDPRATARTPPRCPRPRGGRRAERRRVLRRSGSLQRARARDVLRAPAPESRGRGVDRGGRRREREPRLHDADRGGAPRARIDG